MPEWQTHSDQCVQNAAEVQSLLPVDFIRLSGEYLSSRNNEKWVRRTALNVSAILVWKWSNILSPLVGQETCLLNLGSTVYYVGVIEGTRLGIRSLLFVKGSVQDFHCQHQHLGDMSCIRAPSFGYINAQSVYRSFRPIEES